MTLIHRRNSLRAERVMQDHLFANPKISVIWDSVVDEVLGKDDPKSVTGLRLKNLKTGEARTLPVDGVFVAIGRNNFV